MVVRSAGTKASLMVMVMIVSGTAFAFSSSAANGPPLDNWTVAVYIASDNNLEVAWDMYTLDALLALPSSKKVNVVAMVDLMSTDTIELLEFSGDTYTVIKTYEDMDTGDGDTFRFFLDEVETMYPAENTCIVPWDHGGSWIGVCSDDNYDSIITMEELSTALTEAALPIDVLAFDACLMSSVEVAYEVSLSDTVTYMVASEKSIPFDGFPYDHMFTPLMEDPTATPEELCEMMLAGWDGYYHFGRMVNLVVTDVRALGDSQPVFQEWSEALLNGLVANKDAYQMALESAASSDYAGYIVDMHDLCEQLVMLVEDEAVVEASNAVMAAVEEAVVGLHTSRYVQDMHGLSVWWPSMDYTWLVPRYIEQVQFATDSGWGTFQMVWAFA